MLDIFEYEFMQRAFLAGILIASEGTLAVISEITLKLIPKPKFASS